MSQVSKATRATIKLGDIELDVFQLPDGSYGYSYDWLASLIEIDKRVLSDKKSPFYLPKLSDGLVNIGLTNQTTLVEGISRAKLKYLRENQLQIVLVSLVKLGKTQVLDLLAACAIESLERRADKAFDVVRSEDEYNQRLEQRLRGKATRRTLTDAIKTYIESHRLENSNYAKFVYSNVSDRLNLGIFNRRSHRLKADWELKPSENIRDHLNKDELRWLEQCEDLAMRLIDHDALEPLKAMEEAIARLIIPTVNR